MTGTHARVLYIYIYIDWLICNNYIKIDTMHIVINIVGINEPSRSIGPPEDIREPEDGRRPHLCGNDP